MGLPVVTGLLAMLATFPSEFIYLLTETEAVARSLVFAHSLACSEVSWPTTRSSIDGRAHSLKGDILRGPGSLAIYWPMASGHSRRLQQESAPIWC